MALRRPSQCTSGPPRRALCVPPTPASTRGYTPHTPRWALPSHHGTLCTPPTHGLHAGPFRGTTGLRRCAPHTWPCSHGARHPRRPREHGRGLLRWTAVWGARDVQTHALPRHSASAPAARPRVLAAPSPPHPPARPCSLRQRPPVLRRLRPLPTARGPRRAPAPARSPTPSPADTPPIGFSGSAALNSDW